MNTANWIMLIVYLIGILPAAAWFMWLDRHTMFPSPISHLMFGLCWPLLVPLLVAFLALNGLAKFMWRNVTGRKP